MSDKTKKKKKNHFSCVFFSYLRFGSFTLQLSKMCVLSWERFLEVKLLLFNNTIVPTSHNSYQIPKVTHYGTC